ncbi:MAG: helix-turn-helix domain-containing protein [Vampirovibrionales bacterium]|nr:helix-turn-helix domain-containing protein [Vampirovibrionales bacterium]
MSNFTPSTELKSADPGFSTFTHNLNRMMETDALAASPEVQAIRAIEAPIARAMELLGDKYSFQILHILYQLDRQRFVELEHQVDGISPRTLSARLKHLERCGLITRRQYATIPPKVEYELTERGRDLATTLNTLETWANKWFPYQQQTNSLPVLEEV